MATICCAYPCTAHNLCLKSAQGPALYTEKWYIVGDSGKMFRGKYTHTIDEKGRLMLPVRFRELLQKSKDSKIVITNAISNESKFLDMYPLKVWEGIEKKVSELSQIDPKVQGFQRFYLSSAVDVNVDKQGRILIPQELREYSGLKGDIVLVGMLQKIEIWSKHKWKKVFEKAEKDFENIVKDLSSLGL